MLHRILSEATRASGAAVRLGVRRRQARRRCDAAVAVAFTDGSQRHYDLMVGADGVHSRTRDMLFPAAPKPVFTGQGCWRAVVPRPAEIDCAHVISAAP